MYSKVKSCVRSGEGLTNLFLYKRWVRQGCLLSPLLSAPFRNDLNNVLLDSSEGILLWDTRVCAMLYADDLILLAETREDLQPQMNQSGIYAKNLRMEINEKKTKVLLFTKGRKNKRLPQKWQIGDKMIEEAKSYKHLGITVKDNGLFNEHIS